MADSWIGVLKKKAGLPEDYASASADERILMNRERLGSAIPKRASDRTAFPVSAPVGSHLDKAQLLKHQVDAQAEFDRRMEATEGPKRREREAAVLAREAELQKSGWKKY